MTVHPDPVRLLTRSQVRSTLRWPELIEATAQALIAVAPGGSAVASASQLHVPGAALHLKSGALFRPPVLTVKANLRPEAGSSAGLIVAFDPARPAVRAVLDSADIVAEWIIEEMMGEEVSEVTPVERSGVHPIPLEPASNDAVFRDSEAPPASGEQSTLVGGVPQRRAG